MDTSPKCILTGNNPIHESVRRGNVGIVVMEKYPEARDGRNFRMETPLIMAAQHRTCNPLRSLLASGAELNHQDINGNTALHFAVHRQEKVFVTPLLQAGADANFANNEGKNSLHVAVQYGNHIIVRQLLEEAKEIDVNRCDSHSMPPLILATRYQHFKIAL